MELFVFIVAGAMVIGGALGVVLSKHPVHSALSLVLTLFGVAVLFVAQQANFLAAVQVIVYAGAIVVLFLFVIMLLGVDNAENLSIEPFRIQRPLAAVVGVGTFALIVVAAIVARGADVAVPGSGLEVPGASGVDHDGNIKALARDLFSDHVLAFELTSVLLVIAVVGTVVLARKPRKGDFKVGEA
ncbi:MAG: NADH-quinone oxidoreductase subunit [Actinomycetota bacterium]|jgi:NADH-quinone oxidoreductase subunit J